MFPGQFVSFGGKTSSICGGLSRFTIGFLHLPMNSQEFHIQITKVTPFNESVKIVISGWSISGQVGTLLRFIMKDDLQNGGFRVQSSRSELQ